MPKARKRTPKANPIMYTALMSLIDEPVITGFWLPYVIKIFPKKGLLVYFLRRERRSVMPTAILTTVNTHITIATTTSVLR
jgi:hypothetical protein